MYVAGVLVCGQDALIGSISRADALTVFSGRLGYLPARCPIRFICKSDVVLLVD